jgi:hypothetical protein
MNSREAFFFVIAASSEVSSQVPLALNGYYEQASHTVAV